MTRNSASTTAHVYREGMVVVCMYDHQSHDKLNYLNRYSVRSVSSDEQGYSWLEVMTRQFTLELFPAEWFIPEWYYEGKEDPMTYKDMDPDVPKKGRTVMAPHSYDAQSQQFNNVPDMYSKTASGILDRLVAEGKAPNPKAGHGDKKPSLSLCPLTAQLAQEEAHRDGMLKYGWVNWREVSIHPQTYIEAALRHLRLYEHGEEYARDTGVSNLGAVMACCAILIDSAAHGTMVDNRKHSKAACDALHERGEMMVKHLADMQAQRDAKNGK